MTLKTSHKLKRKKNEEIVKEFYVLKSISEWVSGRLSQSSELSIVKQQIKHKKIYR